MLEKQTRPYEIFIRIGEGGIAHAHFGQVERVVDTATGETVGSPRELPVVPVTVEAAAQYLGQQSAVMLAQIAGLQAEATAEAQRANLAEAERDAALARALAAEAELAAASMQNAVAPVAEEQA